MRRAATLAVAAALAAAPPRAHAETAPTVHRLPLGTKVRAVRAIDVDGDKRRDLVVLAETKVDAEIRQEVVVLRTPAAPEPGTWFRGKDAVRIACDGPAAGTKSHAAVVAVGRFGADGAVRLRFLGPEGAGDVVPVDSAGNETSSGGPTLLGRVPGAPMAFWDAVADLDGDGRDECWWPDASGQVGLGSLRLSTAESAETNDADLFVRVAKVPSWTPADVDGDGKKEVVRLDGATLVVERPYGGAATRAEMPFLATGAKRDPGELRAPRLSLADVDGDGRTDLLVTVVHGRADRVGGLRTSLYHIPGPFVSASGTLAAPRGRLDTESVALHPRFVDVTGDGKLDYVADSIRGSTIDLMRRVMGAEPEVTYTVVRFDAAKGTFAESPYVTFARPYSGSEARGNRFGRSGFFEGDFDGDGVRDLLDLGNLKGVAIWKGGGDERAFTAAVMARTAVDTELTADALVTDLDGDGRAEGVLWSDGTLLVVTGPRR